MGHVVVAAPRPSDWPLVGPLVRRLLQRGHRTALLCVDPFDAAFFRRQGAPVLSIRRDRRALAPFVGELPVDVADLARRDLALADDHTRLTSGPAFVRRARDRMLRLAPGLRRVIELERPDLVLVHNRRDALARLIHGFAEEFGCETLHTGDGVLPGTMQWDPEGVDGDAASCGRVARHVRGQPTDDAFLAAALAAFVGRATAPPLTPRPVRNPDFFDRLGAAWIAARSGDGIRHALSNLFDPAPAHAPARANVDTPTPDLGDRAFVLTLAQPADDPRVRLDSDEAVRPERLLHETIRAVRNIDPGLAVVALQTEPGALDENTLRELDSTDVDVFAAHGTADTIHLLTTALAVVTVNHPLSGAALLTDTPVLHFGTAFWAMRGVTFRTSTEGLEQDLREVLANTGRAAEAEPELRESFLTRLLAFDHVWCDPASPDPNGLRGIVRDIEERIARRRPERLPLRYRAGPVWPLAVPMPRSS